MLTAPRIRGDGAYVMMDRLSSPVAISSMVILPVIIGDGADDLRHSKLPRMTSVMPGCEDAENFRNNGPAEVAVYQKHLTRLGIMVMARLMEMVVLPSGGEELVKTIVLASFSLGEVDAGAQGAVAFGRCRLRGEVRLHVRNPPHPIVIDFHLIFPESQQFVEIDMGDNAENTNPKKVLNVLHWPDRGVECFDQEGKTSPRMMPMMNPRPVDAAVFGGLVGAVGSAPA